MILAFLLGIVLGMFIMAFLIGSWLVLKSEGFIPWGRR